eukprot:110903-Pelagomonas_calceolata.AAC.1
MCSHSSQNLRTEPHAPAQQNTHASPAQRSCSMRAQLSASNTQPRSTNLRTCARHRTGPLRNWLSGEGYCAADAQQCARLPRRFRNILIVPLMHSGGPQGRHHNALPLLR